MQVKSLVVPAGYDNINGEYPPNTNKKLADFFIRYIFDYAYHETYSEFLDGVLKIHQVIEKPLEIKMITTAMINYSYTLGMNINRAQLAEHIQGLDGFIASYNNTSDYSVKIELPYEPTEDMQKIRKKDKVPKHTLMVYKSGLVTQSAPNREFARDAYQKFNAAITKIRSFIIQDERPYTLKYIPVKFG